MGGHNCYNGNTQECIEKKAYKLWKKDGCKPDHDQEYWLIAEESVKVSGKKSNSKKHK